MRERLSPVEAIMWRAGQDPALRMTVGTLMVLDQRVTREALEERLVQAGAAAPRLRRRPDDPTGARARPVWIDDDGQSGGHLGIMAVPAPGGRRELLDLLGLGRARRNSRFDLARSACRDDQSGCSTE